LTVAAEAAIRIAPGIAADGGGRRIWLTGLGEKMAGERERDGGRGSFAHCEWTSPLCIVSGLLQDDEGLCHLCEFRTANDFNRVRIAEIYFSSHASDGRPETFFIRSCSKILAIRG
jgi:hypothetical protein